MLRSLLFVFSGLLFLCASQLQQGTHYCETCGRVCVNFCNTRDFRPCCINFIKKRSAPRDASPAIAAALAQKPADVFAPDENDLSWQHRVVAKNQPLMSGVAAPSQYYLFNSPSAAAAGSIMESDV